MPTINLSIYITDREYAVYFPNREEYNKKAKNYFLKKLGREISKKDL